MTQGDSQPTAHDLTDLWQPAVEQLHTSIARGRTMTWPNFRRLVCRATDTHLPRDAQAWRQMYDAAVQHRP